MDLSRKARRREFVLAFCGHFSAGKSTMLNELYGEELLPTSPIPTSANVVAVRNGEDRVVLTLKSGQRLLCRGTYTEGELKTLAKNGDEVIAVDLWRSGGRLPEGTVLLDTPGIDSTDDAHRVATESALHLADVLFYAMDYNHVQSEVNLQFVKELKRRGKRVCLVINQIDKHRDAELSFSRYQESVERSFADWGIEADGFFYTSLRQKDHPFNEWDRLRETIKGMVREREAWIGESLRREAEHLVREHLADRERSLRLVKEEEVPSSPADLEAAVDVLFREREAIRREAEQQEADFLRGLEDLLANAYLMPFEVREKAKAYLETELTDFRVGLLFSKGKTEKERERRRLAFFAALKETVDNQLDRHLREYVVRFLKDRGVYTEERGREVYGAASLLTPDLPARSVKEGARLTGDYVLKYTGDVADGVKRAGRRQAKGWYDTFAGEVRDRLEARLRDVEDRLADLERALEARRRLAEGQAEHEAYQAHLQALLEGKQEPGSADDDLLLPAGEPAEWMETAATPLAGWIPSGEEPGPAPSATVAAAPKTEEISGRRVGFPVEQLAPTDTWEADGTGGSGWSTPAAETDPQAEVLRRVRRVEELLDGLDGLSAYGEELAGKRRRAEERRYTVALFGAFSAGKSSFANALLESGVLPVSPHPTTAAINRIGPPTEEHGHGEAVVRFKSEAALLEDLKQVYRLFHREVRDLAEALEGIGGLLGQPVTGSRQKAALPFLQAVRKGYASFSDRLGSSVTLPLEEWKTWVAREERSCFVEVADLYYDCPLTRQGVTLVDTPGADSIHARHTDVAFRYIKEADAILFVTYYNHAFSRADREFLIQLGRVKDAFAMDKMFFLMNAADLAASQGEREEVLAYIRDRLLAYGIRNPRLFSVSSLLALEEKTGGRPAQPSGLAAFEGAFTAFLNKDLQTVTLHGLHSGAKRARGTVESLLRAARQGNEEKRRKREQAQAEKETLLQLVRAVDGGAEEHALKGEVEELLYYVRQRLFLRFNDVFAEIFSPGVLREDRGDVKEIFRSCVLEMVDFMRHDLTQEMRATSLRLERWMDGRLQERAEELAQECLKVNGELPVPDPPQFSAAIPEWETPFPQLSPDSFKKTIASFKGSKSFFAKDDKARIREEIKGVLEEAVQGYAASAGELLFLHFRDAWREGVSQLKERTAEEGRRWFDNILRALSFDSDPALLEGRAEAIGVELEGMERALEGV